MSQYSEVPLFTLTELDGKQVTLADLRGKVVLVNFWATWCAPCIDEMPSLQALKNSLAARPFEVLAINLAEPRASIVEFFARHQLQFDFPILLDTGGVVADKYRVKTLPATLLVDKKGRFAFGGIGQRDWASPSVRDEVLSVFAQ